MKKFKIEYLLYIFIIISPFLDAISCLFRDWFPSIPISPSTVLRPIIPLILLIYVFFKDKKIRKYLIISAILMIVYGSVHLLLYKEIITGISFGGVIREAQYIINYTYMIYVLFLYLYFIKKRGLPYLSNSLILMLFSYLGMIYISILSGTSYSTYVEGMGYRGWFTSGNSLSTILVLLFGSLICKLFKERKIKYYLLTLLLVIYLAFLIGTRTGLLGIILIFVIYFGYLFINFILKKKRFNFKKIVILFVLVLVFCGALLTFGSSTFERREHMDVESDGIYDINTSKGGYTTGDTSMYVYHIRNNTLEDGLFSEAQKKALEGMYEFANDVKLDSNNTRVQQLIYHLYLVKYQKNGWYILFGNGYLANQGEMTLEMEVPAILCNFGLLGFILYLCPFIGVFIYCIRKIIINKKYEIENIMNIFSVLLAFALSFLAGYVFFSVSCVLIIICILSLLYKEGEV